MSDTPTLQVEIVTPERSAFSGPATEVLIPAWEGQMGIYPQHDAILALLRAGRCSITSSTGVHEFVVGRGFAEVGPTQITILTEACESKAEVDEDAAKAALEAAEHALATVDVRTEEFRQAQLAEEHAKARLGMR